MSEPLFFIVTLAFLGAIAGTIAGLFGVGGGMIIIPTLVVLFKICGIGVNAATHAAMGVSMMTVVATSIASLRAHARHDAIEYPTVKLWAPIVVVGSILGGLAATQISGVLLSLIFAGFLGAMAVFMGLLPAHMHSFQSVPPPSIKRIFAFVIGFFSALIGIGGGTLSVPTLVFCRIPIHRAIGTASVIGLLISLPAALIFLGFQAMRGSMPVFVAGSAAMHDLLYLDLLAFVTLVPATMLTAPIGARLAHRLPAVNLRRIFAVLLAVIAIKMIAVSFSA